MRTRISRDCWVYGVVVMLAVAADARPTTKRVDQWKAPENLKALQIRWSETPPPNGTTKLDAPLLLYVVGVPSKASAKVESRVLSNTTVALATQLCTPHKVTPDQAAGLRYLRALPRIADPMLVVVGRDFRVHAALQGRKIAVRPCFDAMAKACEGAYSLSLKDFNDRSLAILNDRERLWRKERSLHVAAKRKGVTDDHKRELASIASARDDLANRQKTLRASSKLGAVAPDAGSASGGLSAREQEALRAYRKRARNGNEIERAAAFEVLSGVDSPSAARTILKAARGGDSWVAWQAGRTLGRMRRPESLKVIHAAVLDGRHGERTAALLALAEIDHPPAAARIVELTRDRNLQTRRAAVRAAAGQTDPHTAAALARACADPSPEIRALAVQGLARRRLDAHVRPMVELLVDADRGVRRAAIESLGSLPAPVAVPPLVLHLRRESDVLRDACHDALVALTAQTFRYDADRWDAWWADAAPSFKRPSRKQLRKANEQLEKAEGGDMGPEATRYHSIRTASRRILFVLDVSQDMGRRMPVPPGSSAAVKKELWSGSKFDLARKELIAYLGALGSDVEFDILAFAGGVTPFKGKLVSMKKRKAAVRFLQELKVVRATQRSAQTAQRSGSSNPVSNAGTRNRSALLDRPGEEHQRNLYAALLTALGVLDVEPLANTSRPVADTVFLVTDGGASAGAVLEIPRLTEIVHEINRTRRVVLHVVCFSEPSRNLLAPLATITGGKHVLHR